MLQQKRFLALDVFRGMTICFMIIVNTSPDGDHTFAPLMHAKWHGFTPTDLVFPSFLFAVGNAMSFVMPKWETASTSFVLSKIFKRTLLIFLLGFCALARTPLILFSTFFLLAIALRIFLPLIHPFPLPPFP